MELNNLKEKLIKEDAAFKKEYFKDDLAFGISRLISNVRTYEKIDQTELANLVHTKQSGISRLERGNALPSLTFLQNIAFKLNYKIQLKFTSKLTGAVFTSDGFIGTNVVGNGFLKIHTAVNNSSDTQRIFANIKSPYQLRDPLAIH